MHFAHIFIWHYENYIQIGALLVGLLWVGWMIWGIAYDRGRKKGHEYGYREGYDRGFKAAQTKFTMRG